MSSRPYLTVTFRHEADAGDFAQFTNDFTIYEVQRRYNEVDVWNDLSDFETCEEDSWEGIEDYVRDYSRLARLCNTTTKRNAGD